MKTIILFSLLIINFLNAECADLSYADCIYWSAFCEWNNETGQCQEIGSGGEENNDYIEPSCIPFNQTNPIGKKYIIDNQLLKKLPDGKKGNKFTI